MAPNVQGLWASGDAYENYMGRWSRSDRPALPRVAGGRAEGGLDRYRLWDRGAERRHPRGVRSGARGRHRCVGSLRRRGPGAGPRSADSRSGTGNAMALSFDDREFGVAVSGLVLNFMGDSGRAVAEMVRVVRPAGASRSTYGTTPGTCRSCGTSSTPQRQWMRAHASSMMA